MGEVSRGSADAVDAVVIGSGQGGVPLARALARSGRRTVLVESGNVGGTCVNVGCTPTKTMVASAREVGETRGVLKAVVDADTRQILGCAVLGIEGGEIMAVLQVAMMGHVPYTDIKEGVFAHPTLAESLNNLFMTLDS